MKKNILIADDHLTVRMGIRYLVKDLLHDRCMVTEVTSGKQMLQQLKSSPTPYDLAIMDMNMPEPCGFFLLEQALLAQPNLKVLVLTVNPEELFSGVALQKGAYGFISKNADDVSLKKAIQKVLAGEMYIPKSSKEAISAVGSGNPFKLLSARELEVVMLLLNGKGVLEVSNALSISQSTGSTLKGRVFRKLNIRSLTELVQLASLHGLAQSSVMQSGR